MKAFKLITLGLAFTLVGCQVPLNLPQAFTGTNPAGTPPTLDPTQPEALRMGTLSFAIRWPERDLPEFSAQVIPVSTRTLVFELKDANDKSLVRELIRREAGSAIASKTLNLPVGEGYKAVVKAYVEAEPTLDSKPIAIADASNITVRWGETKGIPLTLTALFAPQIALEASNGTAGQKLYITGQNLDRGIDPPVVVFPSGREVAGVLAGNLISVDIPAGAGSGPIKVRVDGVPSETYVEFQEITSLIPSVDGEQDGGERDGGEAIASWLGDTFPVSVIGKDDAHVLVPNPVITDWTRSGNGVGTLSASGSFQALQLGTDVINAHMGGVVGSRNVIVAPPAGNLLKPAGVMAGIIDHSLTRVGENWLVSWFNPDTKKIYWRLFDKDGQPAPNTPPNPYETPAASDGSERVVRVAATADGTSALIAYRLGITENSKLRNAVVFQALNPLTGAPEGVLTRFNFDGEMDADRLIDMTAGNDQYALGVLRFDGTKHVHRFNTIRVVGQNATGSKQRVYTPTGILYYSQTEDAFSITAKGDQFLVARHFGTNGGAGVTAHQLDLLDSDLVPVAGTPAKAVLHERNRVTTVATNGNVILSAAMEVQASGAILKVYRYGGDLEQIGLGTKVADLNIAGSDPLNWPLKLVWDGEQFILTYARMVGTVENNQIVNRPQAMVQALGLNGLPSGPAYPLAKVSQTPNLVPTPEGGMALWLDPDRSLIMRRVKFR